MEFQAQKDADPANIAAKAEAAQQAMINAGINQHILLAGMNFQQCVLCLHRGLGPLNNSFFYPEQTYTDSTGKMEYIFYVPTGVDDAGYVHFKPYHITFQDGILQDWHTSDPETAEMRAIP